MGEQEMIEFLQWVPSAVAQLQDQLPQDFVNAIGQAQTIEEVDGVLTQVAESSEQGAQLVNQLFKLFKQSVQSQDQTATTDNSSDVIATMKRGGKLDYFIKCYAKGGSFDCGCTPKKTNREKYLEKIFK